MVDARKAIWPIVVTLRTQPKVSATRSNHSTEFKTVSSVAVYLCSIFWDMCPGSRY